MAKGKFERWITPEGLIKLEGWARAGLTDEQIAANMGISRSTLGEWKNKYSVIADTLKASKEVVDFQVENALLKRALGGTIEEEKLTKEGKIVKLKREIPGDVTAQIFWLKNRKPDTWRDKQEGEGRGAAVTIIDDIPRLLEHVKTLDEIAGHPVENRDINDFW